MKQTPLLIRVRDNHTTIIDSHPDGFPVDGDVLHSRMSLGKRAAALIAADQGLLSAARAWLGAPLDPNNAPLSAQQVATLTERLYCGGAARFVTQTLMPTPAVRN